MELKSFEGLEAKIRVWAGDKAKIEVKPCAIGGQEQIYCAVSNDKIFCLVNPQKPDQPYGLGFKEWGDQAKLIKELFKNGKK